MREEEEVTEIPEMDGRAEMTGPGGRGWGVGGRMLAGQIGRASCRERV